MTVAGLGAHPRFRTLMAALERGERAPAPYDTEFTEADWLDGTMPRIAIPTIPAMIYDADSAGDQDQQFAALSAVTSANEADSLAAAIDGVVAAAVAHGPTAYVVFLDDLRVRFPDLAGGAVSGGRS